MTTIKETPSYHEFKNTLEDSERLSDALETITNTIISMKNNIEDLNSDRITMKLPILDNVITFTLNATKDTLYIRMDNRNSLNSTKV